jgi:hypothetical protein
MDALLRERDQLGAQLQDVGRELLETRSERDAVRAENDALRGLYDAATAPRGGVEDALRAQLQDVGRELLETRSQRDAVRQVFSIALEQSPDLEGRSGLAHVLAALGDHPRTERRFDEAVRLIPDLLAAKHERAQTLLRLGNPAAAEGLFRDTLAQRAYVESAYHGLGQALTQQRRFLDAVSAYDEWYRIASPDPAQEAAQLAALERGVPAFVFIAMQKSASEYIRSVLLSATGAPLLYPDLGSHPHNFLIPRAVERVARGGCVTRLHLDASSHNLGVLARAGLTRLAVHLRDPRAATLSFTHHLARIDEQEFDRFRLYHDPPLPSDYRSSSFEAQLAWCLEHYFPAALRIAEGWHELARAGTSSLTLRLTTYEDFTLDPRGFFAGLFCFLGWGLVELESALALHKPELERNFRAGNTQGWRQIFTAEQQAQMREQLARTHLDELGWKD